MNSLALLGHVPRMRAERDVADRVCGLGRNAQLELSEEDELDAALLVSIGVDLVASERETKLVDPRRRQNQVLDELARLCSVPAPAGDLHAGLHRRDGRRGRSRLVVCVDTAVRVEAADHPRRSDRALWLTPFDAGPGAVLFALEVTNGELDPFGAVNELEFSLDRGDQNVEVVGLFHGSPTLVERGLSLLAESRLPSDGHARRPLGDDWPRRRRADALRGSPASARVELQDRLFLRLDGAAPLLRPE